MRLRVLDTAGATATSQKDAELFFDDQTLPVRYRNVEENKGYGSYTTKQQTEKACQSPSVEGCGHIASLVAKCRISAWQVGHMRDSYNIIRHSHLPS